MSAAPKRDTGRQRVTDQRSLSYEDDAVEFAEDFADDFADPNEPIERMY